jgi:hypothetical protein
MRLHWVLGFIVGLVVGVALVVLPYAPSASAGSAPSVDAGTTIVSGNGGLITVNVGDNGASTQGQIDNGSSSGNYVPFKGSEFEKLMLATWCQDQQQEQSGLCDAP